MAQKSVAGPEIERLIQLLAKLPGLGPRSARRAALHLIKKKEQLLVPLADALDVAVKEIGICSICGTVDTSDPCTICSDPKRDDTVLVVVEDVADLWALERAGAVKGRYHVLGGTLSPLDGIGPDDLNLASLADRCGSADFSEVILAISATVEGQTTAHYIMDLLSPMGVNVTKLAHAREDFKDGPFSGRDDENWRKHTLAWVDDDGNVKLDYRPVVLDPLTTFEEGGIDPKKIAPKARVY